MKQPEQSILPIIETTAESRPHEKILQFGAGALTDVELVAVLLRHGRPDSSALVLAGRLLQQSEGLSGFIGSNPRSPQFQSLGEAGSATLLASVELGRRLARAAVPDRDPMTHPGAVARYLSLQFAAAGQEVMGALFLDSRNRLLGEREVYRGTLNRAAVEPRAVLKEGLLRDAAGFVLFHTHPSGDPTPSAEDLAFTRRIAQSGELVGVRLVDHLILGHGDSWISLRQRGGW